MSKKRLGRGLDALLSEKRAQKQNDEAAAADSGAVGTVGTPDADAVKAAADGVAKTAEAPVGISEAGSSFSESSPGPFTGALPGALEVAVSEIVPSPYQPRRHFDEIALNELSQSIRHQGLLQPLVVRARAVGGYELIAGERRWRAAQMAGIERLSVVVKVVTDEEASAFALIENMQREDLSALEEALGLARLRDEFELTQQEIADAVGKSRVAITNLLRLLNLGSVARQFLENGDLDMGHARALLAVTGTQQDALAQQVAEMGLSVRQTEELVRRAQDGRQGQEGGTQGQREAKDVDTLRLEQRLSDHLGAPVTIRHQAKGKGALTIKYSTLEELDGVLSHFNLEDR